MRNILVGMAVCVISLACQSASQQDSLLTGSAEDLWGERIELAEWEGRPVILHPINTAT